MALTIMLSKSKQPRERYYLLPGMGGRARLQKVKQMVLWGVLGGLGASLGIAIVLYVLSRLGRGAI